MPSIAPWIIAVLSVVAATPSMAHAQVRSVLSLDTFGNPIEVELFETAALSPDGRFVAYLQDHPTLDYYPLYLSDRETGTITLVSKRSSGTAAKGHIAGFDVTPDGRFVAFAIATTELDPADVEPEHEVYVRDLVAGTTQCISLGIAAAPGWDYCYAVRPTISDDGNLVAFIVLDATFSGDYSDDGRLFVHDRSAGTDRELVTTIGGGSPSGVVLSAQLSGDGRWLAFATDAPDLVPGDGPPNRDYDAFLVDTTTNVVELVSTTPAGACAAGDSWDPRISADGRFVAFSSEAPDLVAFGHAVAWPAASVFLRDRQTGTTRLISRRADGDPLDDASSNGGVSDDGRFVAYWGRATDVGVEVPLVNGKSQVFLQDELRDLTRVLSIDVDGDPGELDSYFPAISGDGSLVAYATIAENLGARPGELTLMGHELLLDHVASWANYGTGWPGTNGVPTLDCAIDPVLGTTLVVHVGNSEGSPYGIGFLLAGNAPAAIPTRLGGDLLVVPLVTLPIVLYLGGSDVVEHLPYDAALAGVVIYAQVLEFDRGASGGVSFTPGLEIELGL